MWYADVSLFKARSERFGGILACFGVRLLGRMSLMPNLPWRLPFLGLVALQSPTNLFFFTMPSQLPFFLDAQGHHSATLTGPWAS